MWPAARHSRTENVWVGELPRLSWHSDILSMQEDVAEGGRKTGEVVEAEGGLHKHAEQIRGSKHKPGCHNTSSV